MIIKSGLIYLLLASLLRQTNQKHTAMEAKLKKSASVFVAHKRSLEDDASQNKQVSKADGMPAGAEPSSSPFEDRKAPVTSENYTYLGWAANHYWWLANNKYNKDDASDECQELLDDYAETLENGAFINLSWNFAGPRKYERPVIEYVLAKRNIDYAWVSGIDAPDILDEAKAAPRSKFEKKLKNPEGSLRPKRTTSNSAKLISYSSDVSKGNRKREVGQKNGLQITVQQTHYPWLESWKSKEECKELKVCEPVNCSVTTKPCTISTVDCVLNNTTTCNIVDTGKCVPICENCVMETSPECWMEENKCTVVEERRCKIKEPECHVEASPCTITRPPCVTKQAPCKVKPTTKPKECKLPESCGTAQGMSCDKVERACSPEEIASGRPSCQTLVCKPLPICIMPEYCRQEEPHLDCAPPTTFCPPEIVKCPPPKVTCGEPEMECTDPVINCPPPKAVCSKPRVTCSAPKLSCPNVVTQCVNPEVTCSPPIVTCEDPVLKCTEPKPCFVPPSTRTSCNSEPDSDSDACPSGKKCKCGAVKKSKPLVEVYRPCEDAYLYFCLATIQYE